MAVLLLLLLQYTGYTSHSFLFAT